MHGRSRQSRMRSASRAIFRGALESYLSAHLYPVHCGANQTGQLLRCAEMADHVLAADLFPQSKNRLSLLAIARDRIELMRRPFSFGVKEKHQHWLFCVDCLPELELCDRCTPERSAFRERSVVSARVARHETISPCDDAHVGITCLNVGEAAVQ